MRSAKNTAVRIAAILIAALMLVHVSTGVLLNHSVSAQLDQRFISWDWLLTHYGIGNVEPDAAFLVDNKIISQFETQLFVDAKPITYLDRPVLGVIMLEDLLVLATDHALILLSRDGEFIERMGAEVGVPAPIQNIGIHHGEPIIQARNGMWRSNFMLDEWEPMSLHGVSWSTPHPMPDSVAEELRLFFYGKGVSVHQLLTDVHNGRILGIAGVWLVDIISLLLLALALFGLWVWSKRLK
jgi:hypothetical protein